MNIIEKLKSLNVEITPDIEKAFSGEFVSQHEVDKKQEKITEITKELEELKKTHTALGVELKNLKGNSPDVEEFNKKIAELSETLEKERKERAQKDEENRLGNIVSEFFEDKMFVNDITRDAIKSQLVAALNSDSARGKSISDLFDSIVKDSDGNLKPNILISEQEQELAKRRSGIVGNNINQNNGNKLTMAELMKLKNQNPSMDITPYLNQK